MYVKHGFCIPWYLYKKKHKRNMFLSFFYLRHSGTFKLPLDVVSREKSAVLKILIIELNLNLHIHCAKSLAGKNTPTS